MKVIVGKLKYKNVTILATLLLIVWVILMYNDPARLVSDSPFTMRWFVLGLMFMVYIFMNTTVILVGRIMTLEKEMKQ